MGKDAGQVVGVPKGVEHQRPEVLGLGQFHPVAVHRFGDGRAVPEPLIEIVPALGGCGLQPLRRSSTCKEVGIQSLQITITVVVSLSAARRVPSHSVLPIGWLQSNPLFERLPSGSPSRPPST
jgi:hypothetical protein